MSKVDSKLLVFAKAPVPGAVKTRLQPTLSATDAAKLQSFFIEHTLSVFSGVENIDVDLYCFPDETHPIFQQCAQQYDIRLKKQNGNNLGERMANALQTALAEYQQVVVIGTDCPELTVDYLEEALSRLKQGSAAVLGPALDGGYVLLGLQMFSPSLFENINWGTDQVLFQTRTRLSELGWKWDELPRLRDVDTPEDLFQYPTLVRDAGLSLNHLVEG